MAGSFSLEEFRILPFLEMKSYLDNHAKFLGKGSTRWVYDLGDERVLKLAKKPGDRESNRQEVITSKCLHDSDIIAHVLDHDVDGDWLIMEKAQLFKSNSEFLNHFNQALGLPEEIEFKIEDDESDIVGTFIGYPTSRNEWLTKHPSKWWKDVQKSVNSCHLTLDDIWYTNLGLVDNHLVFLDYGL